MPIWASLPRLNHCSLYIKEFLEEPEALIGIQKSKKTYEKYERCYRRVVEFLRDKYHVSDIAFRDLKPMFLVDFEVWLATKKNCSTNTIYKFLQLLRMPILKAKKMGIVFKDPYESYKMKKILIISAAMHTLFGGRAMAQRCLPGMSAVEIEDLQCPLR